MTYNDVKNDFGALCNAILSTTTIEDTNNSHKVSVDCNGVTVSRLWHNDGRWDSVKINGKSMCNATDDEKATVQLYAENMKWDLVNYENGRPYFMSVKWDATIGKQRRENVAAPTHSPLNKMCALVLKLGTDEQREQLKALVEPWASQIEADLRAAEIKAAVDKIVERVDGDGVLRITANECDRYGVELVERVEHDKIKVDVIGATATTKERVATLGLSWDF